MADNVFKKLKTHVSYYNIRKKIRKDKENKLKDVMSVNERYNLKIEIKNIDRIIDVTEDIIDYYKKAKRTGNRDSVKEDILLALMKDAQMSHYNIYYH